MRDVSRIVCVDLVSSDRQKVLQGSYLVRVSHLLVQDKLDIGGRLTALVNLALDIIYTALLASTLFEVLLFVMHGNARSHR